MRIAYCFFSIAFFHINCSNANIINAEPLGFSQNGDFLAIYSYTDYIESYEWKGRLDILDVRNNKPIDSLELIKEYLPTEEEDDLSNRFIVNNLLKSMLASHLHFLEKYKIIAGNLGYLTYYEPIHEYLSKNNDCVVNSDLVQSNSFSISTQRWYETSNSFGIRTFNVTMTTEILDEAKHDYSQLGCTECSKKIRIKILDDESNNLVFDFENQLKPGDCYRDYFVERIYFYGKEKVVIIVYGLRPGFEGLMLKPIFISLVLSNEY